MSRLSPRPRVSSSKKPSAKKSRKTKPATNASGDGTILPFRKTGCLFVCWVKGLRFVTARIAPQLWHTYVWRRESGLGPDNVLDQAALSSRKAAYEWARRYYDQHG